MTLIVGHFDELGYVETHLTKNPYVRFRNGIVSFTDDFDFDNAFPVGELRCIYVKEEEH